MYNKDSEISIVSATPQEVNKIAFLLTACFIDPHKNYFYVRWLKAYFEFKKHLKYKFRVNKEQNVYLLAKCNDKIIGCLYLQVARIYAKKDSPVSPYISNVAVTHSWRRKGIASMLLKKAEETCLNWNHHQIYLHVRPENKNAEKLYLDLGYLQTGTRSDKQKIFQKTI